ncbi:MAG: hypothetical protein R2857_03060 [Vampirovibrionales bacterium]
MASTSSLPSPETYTLAALAGSTVFATIDFGSADVTLRQTRQMVQPVPPIQQKPPKASNRHHQQHHHGRPVGLAVASSAASHPVH